MSKVHFYKYQATGNDFVIIDNRVSSLSFTKDQVQHICHRNFGVGADGLMLIEKHPSLNFNLEYFNSDGSQSLCGNGSRAAVHFASQLGLVNGKATFNAFDGVHSAELLPSGIIKLKMTPVETVIEIMDDYFINTGSPHFVRFVSDIHNYPVLEEGRKIRYKEEFKPGGTNVNFVELQEGNTIFVRTYERGVENETLSCGTGVTAAAIAASMKGYLSPINIKTLGGDLAVEFKPSHPGAFHEIFLIGPAKMVFEGDLEL
ncbi:MAG: diaminopimelate epimerase [Cyclobacteriaceae bacterium]|nr:diaminopimelate epimerase [Cyclobacteriaceae bacterium]MDH4296494.1 diaminopimelate epimerase [Cyclobacteriaceae bacterium]MDH5251329.1 diaminopimelate epimerase [Cyclobacteriaceae bacterium]